MTTMWDEVLGPRPVCDPDKHVAMKVDRAHKPSLLICEVCGRRLKKQKKEEPDTDQQNLF